MKKLLILAAAIVAGAVVNAASFNWQAANIYASNGTDKFTGTATLYAIIEGTATQVATAAVTAGAVTKSTSEFSDARLTAGNYYDFYFVIEDSGKEFKSAAKQNIAAQATSTVTINFANMASQTQSAGNWAAVPEPTSGLLMLLGMAGLALKRKRA